LVLVIPIGPNNTSVLRGYTLFAYTSFGRRRAEMEIPAKKGVSFEDGG
jgi:hypothetical protein